LILESDDTLDAISEYGLDCDNLYAGYVETIESTIGDFYYALFFNSQDYTALILPLLLAPPDFLDTFYINNGFDSREGLRDKYSRAETELTDTFTPGQLERFVELETVKEAALAELQENAYRKGFKDAIRTIYEERAMT